MKARAAAWLLAACITGGCASLADRIVEPRSQALLGERNAKQFEGTVGITHATFRTPEGLTIAYRVIPVDARAMKYDFSRDAHRYSFQFSADMTAAHQLPGPRLRGTVVYLPGWEMDASSMLGWALALADHGYAGIAVDLRNQGGSSRAPAGFGPREAADVVALLDALRARNALREPVYLFGVSYGAATALFAERDVGDHLAGIVAMEPFANAAGAIRTMVPALRKEAATGSMGRFVLAMTREHYDGAATEQAIAEAGRRLGLDLAAIDLHAPLAQSRTCTLLLHGARDSWIPVTESRSLARAAPQTRYVELPDETHVTLPLRIDWLATPIADWMQRAADGRCEALSLPTDPAGVASPAQDATGRSP